MVIGLKRCPRCGERKTLDHFHVHASGRPSSYCKPCESKRVIEWKQRRREQLGEAEFLAQRAEDQRVRRLRTNNAYNRARNQAIKELVALHPVELAALRQTASGPKPAEAARSALVKRHRRWVSDRTRQLRRDEGARR